MLFVDAEGRADRHVHTTIVQPLTQGRAAAEPRIRGSAPACPVPTIQDQRVFVDIYVLELSHFPDPDNGAIVRCATATARRLGESSGQQVVTA